MKNVVRMFVVFGLFMSSAVFAQDWGQTGKILASDGSANDQFGGFVSVSGDTIVIGAKRDGDNGVESGSAYVFVKSGDNWIQQAKLLPDDGSALDRFGNAVSLDGDIAVVGAIYEGTKGAAYIFSRDATVWTQQKKLSEGTFGGDFGTSVSISTDTVVIGADDIGEGGAWVFVSSGSDWLLQRGLHIGLGLDPLDRFGCSVSVSGDTAIIGAYGDDDNGDWAGAVYVFVRNGSVWTFQDKLIASDGAANDNFGISVSLSGDFVLVGSYADDNSNGIDAGAVYVFVREGTSWSEQAKLMPDDGAPDDTFGYSVSLYGETAVVGVHRDDDNGTNSGSAYVFKQAASIWEQGGKLHSSDGSEQDTFGVAVSVYSETAVVGAHNDDDLGSSSGSAYIFQENVFQPFLRFPLRGVNQSSAEVTAIFDHSTPNNTQDGIVTAFNGEEGLVEHGCWYWISSADNGICDEFDYLTYDVTGFKQDAIGTSFFLGGEINYNDDVNGPDDDYLFYDGHTGFDYPAVDGTNVFASAVGEVTSKDGPFNEVIVDHGNGYTTHYLHMTGVVVEVDDVVSHGTKIGEVGLGHLHFTVKLGVERVDPYGWSGAGADPNAPPESLYLWLPSLIFADGFESGDTSSWSDSSE